MKIFSIDLNTYYNDRFNEKHRFNNSYSSLWFHTQKTDEEFISDLHTCFVSFTDNYIKKTKKKVLNNELDVICWINYVSKKLASLGYETVTISGVSFANLDKKYDDEFVYIYLPGRETSRLTEFVGKDVLNKLHHSDPDFHLNHLDPLYH